MCPVQLKYLIDSTSDADLIQNQFTAYIRKDSHHCS